MDKIYDVKKILGLQVRNLRESMHLTQEELADKLGLETYQTINRIENGKSFVTSDLIERMCTFFKVEPYVLFLKQNQTYTPESLDHIAKIHNKLDEICNIISSKNKY